MKNVIFMFIVIFFLLQCLMFFQISGTIANTGHSVIFTADNETSLLYEGPQTPVNLTGGPLSYRYRFQEIHIHYGLHDQFGSEHSVAGYSFPAEVSYSEFILSLELETKLSSYTISVRGKEKYFYVSLLVFTKAVQEKHFPIDNCLQLNG